MNEDNSKKPDEGRLIDYLLNESSPEEGAQIDRLCREVPEWQEAKKELEGTLGLIEEACERPAPEIQEEMTLDSGRRKELQVLHSGQSQEDEEQEVKEPEGEGRTLLFKPAIWAPLAAASCAALLVWGPGQSLDEQPGEQHAAAQPIETEKIVASKEMKENQALSTDAKDDSEELEVLPAEQGIGQLASAQAIELKALDEANRVLVKRSSEDVAKLQSRITEDAESISLADAFSSGRSKGTGAAIGSAPPEGPFAALPAPLPPSAVPPPSVPSTTSDEDASRVDSAKILTEGSSVEANDAAQKTELLAFGQNDSRDSVLTLRDEIGIVDRFEAEAGVDKEFSRKSVTRESKRDQLNSSALMRSKPDSWTDLVRKPASCFLFNKDGQALGQVMVSQSEGKIIGIRRIGEIRQGKRFLLTPGLFELRFADQSGGSVVILSGNLRRGNLSVANAKEEEEQSKRSSDGDYEFEAKDAWWLDQRENRQSLPIDQLVR